MLSRRLLRDLDLDGIGRFVALTPNDDVNMLAVAHFEKLFGASNVHQIRPSTDLGRPLPNYASELQAPHVAAGATFDKLDALAKAGAAATTVSLEETSTLEDVRERLGPDSVPLFAVTDDGKVEFVHVDEPWPTSGTLVSLTPH
jgi:Trk K+ transport system NAD-binding subunit